MPLSAGVRLGPYEIMEPLGAGGMGEVYRARDSRLGREVAVKVLPDHLASSPEIRARFEREAKTISGLNHPNICVLHDVGREGEIEYLVMELVEGETLAQRLERGPLPLADVLRLGSQIALALDRAHRAGVTHRDLKPGNLMLTRAGIKLMDFGLSRAQGLAERIPGSGATLATLAHSPTVVTPLTAQGTLVGTFQYMAPEQLEGREADARSDVWALGCVLYEMATGRRAFESRSQASLISAIMSAQPSPISQVSEVYPAALDRLVATCLAKDPDDRWQSARDVAHVLDWLGEMDEGAKAPDAAAAAPASEPSFRTLTFRNGWVPNARFAPDGRTVLYGAAWDGRPVHVYVTRVESPEATELPLGPAALLSVSSTGELALALERRTLGTGWTTTGTLALAPLFGGAPRELSRGVHDADWTPDGRELAAIRRSGLDWIVEFPMGEPIAASPGWKNYIRVSPDGTRVAYFEFLPGGVLGIGLYVAERGGPPRLLHTTKPFPVGLAWRPDGNEIWYGHWSGPGGTTIQAVGMDGRARTVSHLMGGLTELREIAPSGEALVIATRFSASIGCLAPGAQAERDLSWFDHSIVKGLSVDGRTILFDEQGAGVAGEPQMFVRGTDGSPAVRLGAGVGRGFSPDGRLAIAIRGATVTVLPVGPGAPRKVDLGPVALGTFAAWHPDGKRIVVSGHEEGRGQRLYLIPIEGGAPRPITPEGAAFPAGAAPEPFSPDGATVLAMAEDGVLRFYDVETSSARSVVPLEEDEEPVRWGRDGASVFVWRRGDVPARVVRIDLADGRREIVREIGPTDRTGIFTSRSLMLTPDADAYACTYLRALSEVILVRGLV